MDRLRKKAKQNNQAVKWPVEYINQRTGKIYQPHNDEEYHFVYSDIPRYPLLKGGEGGGKSTAGIVKTLNRLRRGMNGLMTSPDFEHFKKTWLGFVEWCPWECVIKQHRRRGNPEWTPTQPFTLVFHNELGGFSSLLCGGIKEDSVGSWEGPNCSFAWFDESRHHRSAAAIKVLDGRCRIAGPNGEPSQLYLTSTPKKNWMFDFYGPVKDNDPHAAFKHSSYVGTVLTRENAENLEANFEQMRRQTLTENEALVLLEAGWEDIADTEKFIQIIWWDACAESLPPLTRNEPMVIALDAAKGGESSTLADCFAMVGVTRHPGNKQNVAVRYCGIWQPEPGQLLDYGPIKEELKRLCSQFSVIEVCYDPYQLHDTATEMKRAGVALFKEFNQGKDRLVADKQLQNLIAGRRVAHDGNPLLRQHIDNSYVKKYGEEGIRIVKRTPSLKIDGTISLSMSAARILYYNVS